MHKLKYDRYFRVVTAPAYEDNAATVGVEEYDPLDFSDDNILFIASIYIKEGGRSQAVRQAIEIIKNEVKDDEQVTIRINGRRWFVWKKVYPEFNITNLKAGRGGWCGILADDAARRRTTIIERLRGGEQDCTKKKSKPRPN